MIIPSWRWFLLDEQGSGLRSAVCYDDDFARDRILTTLTCNHTYTESHIIHDTVRWLGWGTALSFKR